MAYGALFNNGEVFFKLWDQVPRIVTYQDYIDLCNEIDSAQMDRIITPRDEKILLEALDIVKVQKGVSRPKDW